jgi:hypothetical protein
MEMGFSKSKQVVELFEGPKGIPNDDRAPRENCARFMFPAETAQN